MVEVDQPCFESGVLANMTGSSAAAFRYCLCTLLGSVSLSSRMLDRAAASDTQDTARQGSRKGLRSSKGSEHANAERLACP